MANEPRLADHKRTIFAEGLFDCGAETCPEPLRQADAWAKRMFDSAEQRKAAAQEVTDAVEAFKLEAEPRKDTPERWLWQARIHCLNYAMRSIKQSDPLFGEGAPFGLPWGLIAGRARLDAIECFKRTPSTITRLQGGEGL